MCVRACVCVCVLISNLNADVGRDAKAWTNVTGPYGVGHENSNGLLHLTACTQEGLTITNTFQSSDIHTTTWVHPCSKLFHLIAYVIPRFQHILQEKRKAHTMNG